MDQEPRHTLRQSPAWRERHALLRSVPGAGPQLSVALPADVPKPGAGGRRHIDALVGVAQANRDRRSKQAGEPAPGTKTGCGLCSAWA